MLSRSPIPKRLALGLTLSALAAAGARAEPPRVATDIPPVRSLAAQVMAGVAEPEPILPAGASPHAHALRPSEARTLQEADVVFWIGPALAPWLGEAIAALAPEARAVALAEAEGVTRLPRRDDPLFEPHEHDHPHGEEAHEHDHEHDGRAHEREAHLDHAHEARHGRGGHDHEGGFDPHLWLDPANAAIWARDMAETLAEADPANAERYRANAEQAAAALHELEAEIEAMVAPVRGRPYLVFHDAYQYFERRFDVPAAGAVRLSDGTEPGAARVAALRDRIAEEGVVCVFAEPQFPPNLLEVLVEGAPAEAGTLDPVGAALEPGPGLYAELLRGLARDLAACLR